MDAKELIELREAARAVVENGHQHDVGGGDVFISTCDAAERLERAIAALPSDAAQAPVCWITKEQLDQIEDLSADAWVYWRETGHVAEDDEVALYAVPVAPAAAALSEAQIDAIMEQAQVFASAWSLVGGVFDSGGALEAAEQEKANLRALLAGTIASQAKFECAASKQGSVGGNDPADCDWPVCGCDEHANKVIESLEESGALKSTPIYQIGAPGIAGHQVVWWDVPQEEYERQKAAGYMKTGIVYREAT